MNPYSLITPETCCTGCTRLTEVTGIEPSKEWKDALLKKRQCENNNDTNMYHKKVDTNLQHHEQCFNDHVIGEE